MNQELQDRYINAYSEVIGINKDIVKQYVSEHGLTSLIRSASPLLKTPEQKTKYEAFKEIINISGYVEHDQVIVYTPTDLANYARAIIQNITEKETLLAFYLDTKNRVITYEVVSTGTLDGTISHPRDIYKSAIVNAAYSVALVHNHPSGNTMPSTLDYESTKRMVEVGKILGIKLMDHLIISGINPEYTSIRENDSRFPTVTGYIFSESPEAYTQPEPGRKPSMAEVLRNAQKKANELNSKTDISQNIYQSKER